MPTSSQKSARSPARKCPRAALTGCEAEAAAIVRRHRVAERWLTDVLGLDWIDADEEAARLEHSISEAVEQRLWESLGKPETCPHGNPIPGHADLRGDERRLAELG